MKGNAKVIEQLNAALSGEMSAAVQYMVQAEMCSGWGYHRLAALTKTRAIEEMKHPERSPYACFGPPGARFGNDRFFLERPALRPERAEPHTLVGPLPWREDGRELMPEVIELARQFGYR